jgi:hypothetical protein
MEELLNRISNPKELSTNMSQSVAESKHTGVMNCKKRNFLLAKPKFFAYRL